MSKLVLALLLISPAAFAGSYGSSPASSTSSSSTDMNTRPADTSSATTTATTDTTTNNMNTSTTNATVDTHVLWNQSEMKWMPAPDALPKGSQMAVLYGDPMKSGGYIIRAKFPANYKIPPHTHPATENVTVIQGNLQVGMGDKFETKGMKSLGTGGFTSMPAGMSHYVMAKGQTIVQISGMGPFAINYVNSADDPRNKTNGTSSTTTVPESDMNR
jgi:quercetin dioxygenase-like cupin family protein